MSPTSWPHLGHSGCTTLIYVFLQDKLHFSFSSTLPNMNYLQDSQCELVSFDLEQRSEGRLARNFQKAVDGRSGKLWVFLFFAVSEFCKNLFSTHSVDPKPFLGGWWGGATSELSNGAGSHSAMWGLSRKHLNSSVTSNPLSHFPRNLIDTECYKLK